MQAVRRAAKLLDALADEPAGLLASQLAQRVQLHPSTCHHLLNTLEVEALVVRRDDAHYCLGPQLLYLASHTDGGIPRLAEVLAELDELNLRTRETSYLVAWQANHMTVLAVRLGLEPVIIGDTRLGVREHAYAKASGKAILAFSPPERRHRFMRETTFEARTPHTVIDPDAFLAQLDGVRKQGYSVEIEEYVPGVACLAAPIRYRGGDALGALAISVPLQRFSRSRLTLEAEIARAGSRASELFTMPDDLRISR